jgi:hypothetical protein
MRWVMIRDLVMVDHPDSEEHEEVVDETSEQRWISMPIVSLQNRIEQYIS